MQQKQERADLWGEQSCLFSETKLKLNLKITKTKNNILQNGLFSVADKYNNVK